MNRAEYLHTQDRLLAACLWLTDLPLEEFLKHIERAENAGPVLASSRYLEIRALARGAQGLVRVLAADPALVELARAAAERVAAPGP